MGERHPEPRAGRLLDFAPVLRNREALGYILGYGAHCFELYGIRTWIVGFWTFVVASHAQQTILTPLVVSFVFAILAMPASILGNEAAIRFGRHRAITTFMIASACVALAIGWNANASPMLLASLLLIYALTVPADSGALTAEWPPPLPLRIAEQRWRFTPLSVSGFPLRARGGSASRLMQPAVRKPRPVGWPLSW
jgi:hypothetical protein